MIPIFYINLDSNPERNTHLMTEVAKLGLAAQRISAIDGKALMEQDIAFVHKHNFLLKNKRHIKMGEIGCAMSHRPIWQMMIDDGIDYALILEDDVEIDSKLIDVLNTQDFYEQFDFLNLSSNSPYNPNMQIVLDILQNDDRVERANNPSLKRLDWGKHWKIYGLSRLKQTEVIACECNYAPALTSGYILSLKGAKHFLKASNCLDVPIDNVWRYADGELCQAFLILPLVVQKGIESSIGDGRDEKCELSLTQKIQRFLLKRKPNPRLNDVKKMYGE